MDNTIGTKNNPVMLDGEKEEKLVVKVLPNKLMYGSQVTTFGGDDHERDIQEQELRSTDNSENGSSTNEEDDSEVQWIPPSYRTLSSGSLAKSASKSLILHYSKGMKSSNSQNLKSNISQHGSGGRARNSESLLEVSLDKKLCIRNEDCGRRTDSPPQVQEIWFEGPRADTSKYSAPHISVYDTEHGSHSNRSLSYRASHRDLMERRYQKSGSGGHITSVHEMEEGLVQDGYDYSSLLNEGRDSNPTGDDDKELTSPYTNQTDESEATVVREEDKGGPWFQHLLACYLDYPAKLWVKDKRWWLWKTGVGEERTKDIMMALWFAMADVPEKPGVCELDHVIRRMGKDYGIPGTDREKVFDQNGLEPSCGPAEILDRLIDANGYVLPYDPIRRRSTVLEEVCDDDDQDIDETAYDPSDRRNCRRGWSASHLVADNYIGTEIDCGTGEIKKQFLPAGSYANHIKYREWLLSKVCGPSNGHTSHMVCTCPVTPGQRQCRETGYSITGDDDGEDGGKVDNNGGIEGEVVVGGDEVEGDNSFSGFGPADDLKEFGKAFLGKGCPACSSFYYQRDDVESQALNKVIEDIPQNIFRLCRSWSIKDRRHPMWKCLDPLRRLRPFISGKEAIPI